MKVDAAPPGRRFGIRARLLVLLLPCAIGLLALDSWNDYAALRRQVHESHDRVMQAATLALRSSAADAQSQASALQALAAQDSVARDRALAHALRQQLLRDLRMLLMLVLVVWLGVRWSLRPLDRLRDTVLRSRGQAPAPLAVHEVPREVAPLVDALNQHVAAHRSVVDAQSQFLADASHQLRTPLAIMLTQAGVALRESDPARLHETLQALRAQIERSRRLSEQLLSLAHAGEGAAPAQPAAVVDLNALTREAVLQHLALAHEKEQDLGWEDARTANADHAPPSSDAAAVPVLASEAELREVLANLVHNAIVHTPRGGCITVRAAVRGAQAIADVTDDGPGIAPEHRSAVFERFRQIDGAPATQAAAGHRGSGLGLAIARAYAQRQGGDIELSAPEAGGAGLRATLRLPLHTGAPSRT